MKAGYSLIEVVVALLIASLITLSLFQLLTQTRRAVRRITNVIEVDEPFLAFYNQLEKDVTGMFAPQSSVATFQEKDEAAQKAKAQEAKPDAQNRQTSDKQQQKPGQPGATQPGAAQPQKKFGKPIQPVFSLNSAQDQFFWSFITTGGLNQLEPDGTPVALPFIRRVAYLLERDPQRPQVYRLMYRFGGDNLDIAPYQAADFKPSYELISGIKHFEIEFTLYEIEEKKSEPQKPGANGSQPPQQASKGDRGQMQKSTTVKEWNENEIFTKYKTLIPAYVRIKGIRVDNAGAEYPFEFMFKVYGYNPSVSKPKTLFEELERIAESIFTGGKR